MSDHNVLGVMSGTSLDGLDIALCNYSYYNNKWNLVIIKTKCIKYETGFRERLRNGHLLAGIELKKLDNDFAILTADEINRFLSENNLKADLISSHGHTIFHRPDLGFTHQIGNGEIIAKRTGIPVVFDFRSGDVALGGQGAPLVPAGDELLFGEYSACLNLGGFSNISYRNNEGRRVAYDISPVNIILNKLAMELGFEYDNKGLAASSGKTDIDLLGELDKINFYSIEAPKSLSREWVEMFFLPVLSGYRHLSIVDIINTVTVHIAVQISQHLQNVNNVLVTGGGAYNDFLIENIRIRSAADIVIPPDELVDFKEAVVFGFLGLLRYEGKINCLSTVTGAKRDSSCGSVVIP